MADRLANQPATSGPKPPATNVRVIKRYANRKLYDTDVGELTSLHRIEGLIRSGIDIRAVDHSSGLDITAELLASILATSVGEHPREKEIAGLLSLIRSPARAYAAMADDDLVAEQLASIRERVRLLAATVDALLENAAKLGEPGGPQTNGAGGPA